MGLDWLSWNPARDFSRERVSDFIISLRENWWMADWGMVVNGDPLKDPRVEIVLHTGGFADNEDLMDEIQKSDFWRLFWQKSVRGGHFWFEIDLSDVWVEIGSPGVKG